MSLQSRAHKLAFAKKMIETLETQLMSGAMIVSVSTDGVSTTFNREQALKELEMWRKQAIRYSRSRSGIRNINLGGGIYD